MKKLAILLIALIVLLASVIPAMAVDITVVNGDGKPAAGSTFKAYQLLTLTTSLKCTSEEEGHAHTDDCYHYAYTVNSKYQSILAEISQENESADIVNYISGVGDAGAAAFADTVYRAIQAAGSTIEADITSDAGLLKDAAQGYYLIVETDKAAADTVYSKAMLDTQGELKLTVQTKKNIPTVVKEVKEENDSTGADAEWKDSADHDVGDEVSFRLTGTLPADYSSYTSYEYEFVDTLTEGLTVPTKKDEVTEEDEVIGLKVYAVNKVKEEGAQTETEDKVEIPDTHYTATYKNNILKVSFADLKAVEGITIDAATEIVVEYSAKLNENAKIGAEGNPNEVYLNFSNNPYGEGTGKTIEDEVTVFTFEAVVNKVGEDEITPLEGAGFTLYKYEAKTETWEVVGEEIKSTAAAPITTFEFKGIDAGTYKIVETTVPAGYNKAADIEFKVVATYTEGDPDTLAGLTVKENGSDDITISTTLGEDGKPLDKSMAFITNADNGTVSTTVVNTTGVELPSTGGIGTTIFYVGGGLLVLAALALMLTRKCMRCPK